jgi:hypothetical protein
LLQLPSVESIDAVFFSLQTAIENSNSNNFQTENTGTENNQIPPSSPSFTPSVTPDDVIAQQAVVEETQSQVAALQEQLIQTEEQLPPLTPAPPAEIKPTTNPNPENNIDKTNDFLNTYTGSGTESKGIIIQPGPPQLIQGTNQY